jgi:hypothetical protein
VGFVVSLQQTTLDGTFQLWISTASHNLGSTEAAMRAGLDDELQRYGLAAGKSSVIASNSMRWRRLLSPRGRVMSRVYITPATDYISSWRLCRSGDSQGVLGTNSSRPAVAAGRAHGGS